MTEPILEQLLELDEGEETIIYIMGQAFIVSKATPADVRRVTAGYACMD